MTEAELKALGTEELRARYAEGKDALARAARELESLRGELSIRDHARVTLEEAVLRGDGKALELLGVPAEAINQAKARNDARRDAKRAQQEADRQAQAESEVA